MGLGLGLGLGLGVGARSAPRPLETPVLLVRASASCDVREGVSE